MESSSVSRTTERDMQELRWRLTRSLYSSISNDYLKLPWENRHASPMTSKWPMLHSKKADITIEDDEIEEPLVKRPRMTFAALSIRGLKWEVHEDLLRQQALVRWRVIIEENLLASQFGTDLYEVFEDPRSSVDITLSLKDVFERKSTATLAKRAGSIMAYIIWCRRAHVQAPLNLTEKKVYDYVCHLRDSGSASTTARTFIEALHFAEHTIGLFNVESSISARVRGCSSSLFKTKRPLKQSTPLTVNAVYCLEKIVLHSKHVQSVCAAGYFLMCVYACCRYSDAMRLRSIELDMVQGEEFGFVESKTIHHKTGNTDERRTTFLPIVALAWGTAQTAWARRWIRVMTDEGLLDQEFVLPAPLRTGKWSDRPLTVGEASIWLRELLASAGCCPSDMYTAHSLKTTGLSWCAKAGLTIEERRMLGHHLESKGTSALTYSRDALAGPLTKFAEVVKSIRDLQFCPDESRAVRAWGNLGNEVPHQQLTEPVIDKFSDTDRDSGSESMSEEVVAEAESARILEISGKRNQASPSDNLRVHKESGLGHLVSRSNPSRFKCGKLVNDYFLPIAQVHDGVHMCLICSPVSR